MPSYTYGGKQGRKVTLKVAEDRIAVRTRNQRSLREAVQTEKGKEVLSQFNVEQRYHDADVSVLCVKTDIEDKEATRDEARSVLKDEADLRFAGRVLVDEATDEPILYTENIFLQFKKDIPQTRCFEVLNEFQLSIKIQPKFAPNAFFVGAPEGTGMGVFELSERLLDLPEVELCHPELVQARQEKSIHALQWHLQKTTINGVEINAHANVADAHNLSKGEGIIIAIIDDGVDIDHPEFNSPGKVVSPRDVTKNTSDPRPKNWFERHGTACAGVACADGVQASGVAPHAKLMPIRLASGLGSFNEAQAFIWAADNGADVISCSWGPPDGAWANPTDPKHDLEVYLPDSTRLAIDYAVQNGRNGKGCIVLFAAGNGRESADNDGYTSYENVISVSACNDRGKRSVYSDFGKNVWCCFPSNDRGAAQYNQPAPLTNGIYTTDRHGGIGYSPLDYTDDFGGTSSSTPGVAGICALMLAVNPDLTQPQVRDILRRCCEPIDTESGAYTADGHSIYFGYGRTNALTAVELAQQASEAEDSAPIVHIVSALVNPAGSDTNKETITVRNDGSSVTDLANWMVCDDKGRKDVLPALPLPPGEKATIKLKKARLGNRGGSIRLLYPQGNEAHCVTYTLAQATPEGKEVEF